VKNGFLNWTGSRGVDVWLMLGDNAYDAGSDAEPGFPGIEPLEHGGDGDLAAGRPRGHAARMADRVLAPPSLQQGLA
jgi:hypothetical protein